MILKNLVAQRLLQALRTVDAPDVIKLSGKTRLDIARNINRLMPEVMAFERACNAKTREIRPGDEHLANNNKIILEIEALRDEDTDNVKLYKLAAADLSVDDNPRITGETIAALAPILKDFDTVDPPDDQ